MKLIDQEFKQYLADYLLYEIYEFEKTPDEVLTEETIDEAVSAFLAIRESN